MDRVWQSISFGVGRRNAEQVDHPLFEGPAWKCEAAAPLKQMAREQLGTVGSGNHYVDLFTDEQDRVWIGVHFGSRGLGHKIATWFLKKAGAKDGMDVDPCVIDARVMGRMEAKGKTDRKTGQVLRAGKVTTEMMQRWLNKANVELRGAGLDESPDCYKRLPEVLAEHGKSIRILHTLTPVGVAMAGANEFDPYKD
jgi:RNA-splicing ligase RtcB